MRSPHVLDFPFIYRQLACIMWWLHQDFAADVFDFFPDLAPKTG